MERSNWWRCLVVRVLEVGGGGGNATFVKDIADGVERNDFAA